jgi:N-acetylglucosaminyldiphosphoundecaprenol N-acetyl-beta-D-mannosaminyltransferase
MIEVKVPVQRKRVEILGVPVDCVTMDEAIARIESFILSKEPHIVATADSSGLVIAQSDPVFKEILKAADLVTPDSAGVLWACRKRGAELEARVSGVDILSKLCAKSADKGYRLFFLGSAPGIAELAAEKLRLQYPGCNIVGTRHGYFPPDSDAVVAAEIAEAKPDVVFVAMGIPRQEKFIAATREIIRAPVAIGVGGSLDVFSGKARRAPKIIQKLWLEWLWRVLLNPSKFTKVKTLPIFAWMVLREKR